VAYRIKNWSKHQHFKDRTPPWIKLYRDLLDDPEWFELDSDCSKVLVMLWLIASEDETKNGMLPSVKTLAFRMRISEQKTKQALTKLSHWVIQDDISVISERYQVGPPETETETETEGETESLLGLQANHNHVENRLNGKKVMVEQVMQYLNLQARRNYRVQNPNGTLTAGASVIAQRLKEGYTVEQCKDVIGVKSNAWMGDEKMDQYLNPQTLFRKSNFDKYLAEAEAI
jgi:uncharacterized phage protein (TIGR02220 family)